MSDRPVVVAVGTTHPFAVAGLLVEMTAIRALGGRALAVIAGVSAQDAGSVRARMPVDAATIGAQFAAIASTPVGAFCVGALLDAASVAAVAAGLTARPGIPVVCDPVIAASGGDRLADAATVAAMREHLFPRCTLLTPNLAEAAMLASLPIGDLDAMHAALPALLALGPRAVLLKGGHLTGDACDVLVEGDRVVELRSSRLAADLRGTGSLLAAAIATGLARGDVLDDAVRNARAFVRERIVNGTLFAGMRVAY